jgi:intein-encoded DNA endonuclease-like protein
MYNEIPKKEILKIHSYSLKKKEEGFGQRKIKKMILENFGKDIAEPTISNWIYREKIPFENEKTQFKAIKKNTKSKIRKIIY